MTLSRTKKYKDLRDRLQHDTSADSLSTNDLSRFEKRLNQIDSQNFAMPSSIRDEHNAEHARSHEVEQQPLRRKKQETNQPSFDTSSYYTNENDATFDNDYLDQYIREVKQYNIDQGNAASENTSLNILKQIERNNQKAPSRPYKRERGNTTDIPFIKQDSSTSSPFLEPAENTQQTQPLTKEDIMAEVQNMVNGTGDSTPEYSSVQESPKQEKGPVSSPFLSDDDYNFEKTMGTDTFNRHIEADRTTRQQLLNETTQMRAQLDDYEDNLSEVSDKMRQTNRILNIVLVILIIALAIIVGIVIYFIMTSK